MPGLENGSSLANAFSWDPTAYPGGTRVFAATTYNQSQDWWALYLLAGKTYVFQTRLPTTWSTTSILPIQGSHLASSSSAVTTGTRCQAHLHPRRRRMVLPHHLRYYYYGYYVPYVLERSAPKSFRTLSSSCGRFPRAAFAAPRSIALRRDPPAHASVRKARALHVCAKTARVNGCAWLFAASAAPDAGTLQHHQDAHRPGGARQLHGTGTVGASNAPEGACGLDSNCHPSRWKPRCTAATE
jgi:hypothetical protein